MVYTRKYLKHILRRIFNKGAFIKSKDNNSTIEFPHEIAVLRPPFSENRTVISFL
ncbi:hypothetical protein [Leptospira santarosai]|uniref:hypothetical protein n=1 Tax=Leptospira santarosai TaxID=28183 RepID=UPI00031BC232|nr:hypothetical protein [Leptospira santarosai]